jgi:hypothetical protein
MESTYSGPNSMTACCRSSLILSSPSERSLQFVVHNIANIIIDSSSDIETLDGEEAQ